jgi:hypothetical protein
MYREEYEKYAKEHLRLLNKYEGVSAQHTIEPIEKTFRKQPKLTPMNFPLLLDPKTPNKNPGFLRN